jgi:KDO2-lipid IV(A) lauroyltransferase
VVLRALRLVDPDRTARFTGRVMQRIGPLLKEHRIGRENLVAAFPEKSSSEIDAILDKVWENLGMFAGEFAHLDRMWDYNEANPAAGRIDLDPVAIERFLKLRDDGKGALIFAAHLGNWELPALVGPAYGLDSAVVFRPPNLNAVADAVERIRAVNMGTIVPTERDAPLRLARMLEAGTHAGMLVDQYYVKGVDVVFFGRKTKCNPLLARLAARIECPIHGVRVIRRPNHRFRLELSDEVAPVRTAEGKIDVQGTMQAVTNVVEGWIREYPEQWLWLHRRWR